MSSTKPGKKYSVDEAIDIIVQCHLILNSVEQLCADAIASLSDIKPDLRVIDGGKADKIREGTGRGSQG